VDICTKRRTAGAKIEPLIGAARRSAQLDNCRPARGDVRLGCAHLFGWLCTHTHSQSTCARSAHGCDLFRSTRPHRHPDGGRAIAGRPSNRCEWPPPQRWPSGSATPVARERRAVHTLLMHDRSIALAALCEKTAAATHTHSKTNRHSRAPDAQAAGWTSRLLRCDGRGGQSIQFDGHKSNCISRAQREIARLRGLHKEKADGPAWRPAEEWPD
jgi:hypothetical protein